MKQTLTVEEWAAAGKRRFGDDRMKWRFKCPSCGYEACGDDWKAAGAPDGAVAFSCVGRWLPDCKGQIFDKNGGPCNYTGGGMFRINPVTVITEDGSEHNVFAFAAPISVTAEGSK